MGTPDLTEAYATREQRRVEAALSRSCLPMRFQGKTFNNIDKYGPGALESVHAWIAAVRAGKVVRAAGSPLCGVGLVLQGAPGVGKSLLATLILRELAQTVSDRTWAAGENRFGPSAPVLFATYPKILTTVRDSWRDDDDAANTVKRMFGMAGASNVRVLVVDDLGKEHRTNSHWAENSFDQLLRQRFDEGLPTIITTNVPVKDWATVYGAPMESFVHEAMTILPITSPKGDRRRKS